MKTSVRRILALVAVGLTLGALSSTVGPAPAKAALPAATGTTTIAPLLDAVTPAVVNIAVVSRRSQSDNPLLRDPFFRHFFNIPEMPQARPQTSAGSGVIVDAAAGFVVTNNHVIADADEITVTLKDRRHFRARLVGADAATDVALLKIEADNLTALKLADSDRLRVGDFVVAIGNPFGLGQTVTSGIVSALGRSGLKVEGYEDFIQTDASINPGNSGGALVDFNGQMIGMNTAIIGPSGGSVGIGFAVPSTIIGAVMSQIREHGEVRRGRLGVAIQDLTPDLADSLGVTSEHGAVIAQVEAGSAADRGGLRTGDVVVAVDGRPVHSGTDLRNRVGLVRIGTPIEITFLRGGSQRTISIRTAK